MQLCENLWQVVTLLTAANTRYKTVTWTPHVWFSNRWNPFISRLMCDAPLSLHSNPPRRCSHWLLSFCYSNKPNPGVCVCVVCAPASLAWFLPHLPPPETTGRNIQKAIPKRGVLTDWKIRQHRTIWRGGRSSRSRLPVPSSLERKKDIISGRKAIAKC